MKSLFHAERQWRGVADGHRWAFSMKRLSFTEIIAFFMGLVFIVAGIVFLVRPTSVVWGHPTTNPASAMPEANLEIVNDNGCRIYGGLGVLVGAGLAAFAVLPLRKSASSTKLFL